MADGIEIASIFVSLALDTSNYTSGLDKMSSATQSWAGKIGGFFENVAAYATGGLIVQGIQGIASSITEYGSQALESYAANERLGMSLESLIAKEIRNTTAVTNQITVGQALVGLTKKEQTELDKLSSGLDGQIQKRGSLSTKISIAQQELTKLQSAEDKNEISIQKKQASIQDLQYKYDTLNTSISTNQARITELTSKQGQLVDVTKQQTTFTLDMSQALNESVGPAKELQSWIEKLAILSPFESKGIADAYQMGLAFNFTSNNANGLAIGMEGVKQAQEQGIITNDRIVTGLVDWASAAGKTTFEISNAQRALGQMNVTGKVMKQDLNQLTTAGFDWMSVLNKMGYTLDDVTAGVVDADDFIKALVGTIEDDFGGAAERQSNTWSGLINSLGDIKKIGLREFFAGTFQAIQPYVSQFVGYFTDGTFLATLQSWGSALGQFVGGSLANLVTGVTTLSTILGLAKEAFNGNVFASQLLSQQFGMVGQIIANASTYLGAFSTDAQTAWTLMKQVFSGEGFSADLLTLNFGKVGTLLAQVSEGAKKVVDAFNNGGIGPAITTFGTVISETLGTAWTTLIWPKLSQWGTDFWNWLTGSDGAQSKSNNVLTTFFNYVNTGFQNNWPTIKKTLDTWSDKFWDWLTGSDGAVQKSTGKLGEWTTSLNTWVNGEGKTQLTALGKNVATFALDGLDELFKNQEKMNTLVGDLIFALGKAVLNLAEAQATVGSTVGSGVIQGIIEYVTGDKVSTSTGDAITKSLKQAAIGINPLLIFTPVGEDMMNGLVEGIKGGMNWVADAAMNAAEAALEAAEDILGISSPSKVAEDRIGKNFDAGVSQGILGGMGDIQSAAAQAVDGIDFSISSSGASVSSNTQTSNIEVNFSGSNAPTTEQEAENSAYLFVNALQARGVAI